MTNVSLLSLAATRSQRAYAYVCYKKSIVVVVRRRSYYVTSPSRMRSMFAKKPLVAAWVVPARPTHTRRGAVDNTGG